MTALQAQDYPGAVTSVALRTTTRNRGAVEKSLDAGDIVRSYPMRGTLHFVAANDLAWMLELTATRLISAAATRRAALGLDLAMIEQARNVAIDNLTGGRRLRRAELIAAWKRAGLLLDVKQRSYHFIWHLAQPCHRTLNKPLYTLNSPLRKQVPPDDDDDFVGSQSGR